MPLVLIVDDEPAIGYSFARVLGADGVEVQTAGTGADAVRRFRDRRPDAVVLDYQLPDRTGLDVFRELHALDPSVPVVLITAHGTTDVALAAMTGGAFDYLVKPVSLARIRDILARAFEAGRPSADVPLPAAGGDRIVGRSAVMQEMAKRLGRVATTDATVLITGESGTGKELVARAVIAHSRRAAKPFLALNCAALPETLLESELFGHERGAFTGADRRRAGKFEQCDGGTLFLDELGEMPPAVQAKMLRVLQDGRFERLGGTETIRADVRLIAATNVDLARQVEQGKFRADLFYRLRVVTLAVPPLRDRPDDIPDLAALFLSQNNTALGTRYDGLHPEALARLRGHAWPGNVRELQSVLKEAMLRGGGRLVLAADVAPSLAGGPWAADPATAPAAAEPPAVGRNDIEAVVDGLLARNEPGVYHKVMEQVERLVLSKALQHTGGRQGAASDILGINRTTLRNRLRDLGMSVSKVVVDDGD